MDNTPFTNFRSTVLLAAVLVLGSMALFDVANSSLDNPHRRIEVQAGDNGSQSPAGEVPVLNADGTPYNPLDDMEMDGESDPFALVAEDYIEDYMPSEAPLEDAGGEGFSEDIAVPETVSDAPNMGGSRIE